MLKHDASLGLLLMSHAAVAATVRVDSQVEINRRQTVSMMLDHRPCKK